MTYFNHIYLYLGRFRLEGGVGVASTTGGRLFGLGLPLPPEITEGVWSFFTLKQNLGFT